MSTEHSESAPAVTAQGETQAAPAADITQQTTAPTATTTEGLLTSLNN